MVVVVVVVGETRKKPNKKKTDEKKKNQIYDNKKQPLTVIFYMLSTVFLSRKPKKISNFCQSLSFLCLSLLSQPQ